jgi:hypothetical protein
MDQVTFEAVQEFSFHNQNCVKQFLHLIAAGFIVKEDFADVVD